MKKRLKIRGDSSLQNRPDVRPDDEADGAAGAPAPRRRAGLRMLAALLGLMAALVVAEIGVRALGIEPVLNVVAYENFRRSENAELRYELVPGSPDGRRLKMSSAGLRDREFPESAPAGTFRVAIVGDSVTFGLDCPRAQTHAKFLERFLRAARADDAPQFEVMNFGVVGYNAREIAETLRSRVARFAPDLVIWAYVANDPQSFSMEMGAIESLERDSRAYIDRLRDIEVPRFLRSSRLAMLLWERTVQLPVTAPTPTDPVYDSDHRATQIAYLAGLHDAQGMRRVGAALDQLARVRRSAPSAAGGNVGSNSSPETANALLAIMPADAWLEDGTYALAPITERVLALAGSAGLTAIDLQPTISRLGGANPSWLFDDILHPTPVGQKYVAASLFCELADRAVFRADWIREELVGDSVVDCAAHLIENVD